MIFFQTKYWCQRCYRKIVLYSSLEAVTQFDALGPYKPLRLVKNEQTLAPSLALKHQMMTFKNNIISACMMSQHVLLELGLFMHALEKRGWGRMGWGGVGWGICVLLAKNDRRTLSSLLSPAVNETCGWSDRSVSNIMRVSWICEVMSALGCCPNASGWSMLGSMLTYSLYDDRGPSRGM